MGVDDEPDTEIADIKNPTRIKASVGDSGQNSRRDVAKTEQLLGDAGTLDLKKTDGPTGYLGTRTSDATKAFQKQNGLKVDGEINPGGETIRVLGKLAGQIKRVGQDDKRSIKTEPVVVTPSRHPREGGDPLTNQKQSTQVHPSKTDSRLRGNDDNLDVGIGELTQEAFSENQRAARYLASRDGIGDFSKFVADGIETDGDKAIAETVDLYHQTADLNQKQADALIDKVMPGLSLDNAKRLQSSVNDDKQADRDLGLDKAAIKSQIWGYKKDKAKYEAAIQNVRAEADKVRNEIKLLERKIDADTSQALASIAKDIVGASTRGPAGVIIGGANTALEANKAINIRNHLGDLKNQLVTLEHNIKFYAEELDRVLDAIAELESKL